MISIKYEGRLGNCLFQYAAARIFANKFGLIINQKNNLYLNSMAGGLVNYVIGGESHREKDIILNDDNYLRLYYSRSIETGHYILSSGMQNPDFIIRLFDQIKETVRMQEQDKEAGSLLVHVRLGDCDNSSRRLPYGYYRDALINTSFSKGYICSDSMNHPDIKSLIREFNLVPYDESASSILKNCNKFDKVILSEGTFSWWIGVLSEASEVIINKRKRSSLWHGDIFVFPDWKETLFCS